jgi:hypothetical protein
MMIRLEKTQRRESVIEALELAVEWLGNIVR